jgi:hypothetical protein
MHRTWRRHALWILLGAATLAPAVALAEPTAADSETARALGIDGRAKLDARDYPGAYRSLKAAHEILGAPTTGLDLARALDGLGLLIEARAAALDVARIPPAPSEPDAFTDARAAAAALADKLAARIPSVEIAVTGIAANVTPSVTLDGSALSSSQLTLPRKINPGAHTVMAAAPGYTFVRRAVTVPEGETMKVELALTSTGATSGSAPSFPPMAIIPPDPPRRVSQERAAGFAVGFVGLIGVGVGAAFGGMAIAKNDLTKRSISGAEPPCDAQSFCDASGKALRYEAFQAATISTVGFIAGGVLLAGGAVLILTAPAPVPVPIVAIGPGSISVMGSW